MKIAIIGAAGMLGSSFTKLYEQEDKFDFRESDKIKLIDITKPDSIKTSLNYKYDIIINCAAYTDVDGAESGVGIMKNLDVNALAVRNLAKFCADKKIKLVHFSTDYVFGKEDGVKAQGIFKEDDIPNPINSYGMAKFAGERYITDNLSNFLIVRTQWLYGPNGRNFVEAILNRAKLGMPLFGVDDQIGCPTFAKDLAMKVKEMIERDLEPGIWHITNSGSCNWYEFAREIVSLTYPNLGVIPVTTEFYNNKFGHGKTTAKRPKSSVLSNDKLNGKSEPMRHWKDALRDYLSER